MTGYKFLFAALCVLAACKPQNVSFESTAYDLYKESQFANGFALIKDDYGKRMEPDYDGHDYAEGIMNSSVMFGEMDLSEIKKQVIARMDEPEAEKDEEGIWRPLYDGVRKSHGHPYNRLTGWVYWLIFNPQADKSKIGASDDPLIDIAITTAMSRANVPYWHSKILACMSEKIPASEQTTYQVSWVDATHECQKEYVNAIEKIAAEIYPQLKTLPQYQE